MGLVALAFAMPAAVRAADPVDPGPAEREPGRTGPGIVYEVMDVDRMSNRIDVQRVVGRAVPPLGDDAPPRAMVMDFGEFQGRMETEYGFPLTIAEIEPGMRMRVFFDTEGEVDWIIVTP